MAMFSQISIGGWRQFENLSIDLGSQVTVITGPNGTGKTSILNLLNRHFGWTFQFVSAPLMSKRSRKRIFSDFRNEFIDFDPGINGVQIGEISYSDGRVCSLRITEQEGSQPQYHPKFMGAQPVTGLHIPSHRTPATFQSITTIPTNPKSQTQLYQEFQQLLFKTFGSAPAKNPSLVLKQSLIALAVFGFQTDAVEGNEEYRSLFNGFQDVLRLVLPPELGFERIEVRMPDVVLVTRRGSFSLDAMSGGISSVFSIAWQIFMYGAGKAECTVLIDEPENHLHPQMQRTLLPNLSRAFPDYKFIVATHSPFIISSHESAAVYGLAYAGSGGVYASRLSAVDLAAGPEQILEDVLGVPTSIPVWVEERIRRVLSKYPNPSKDMARQMLRELQVAGLEKALAGYSERSQ